MHVERVRPSLVISTSSASFFSLSAVAHQTEIGESDGDGGRGRNGETGGAGEGGEGG